jgi:hypothetical protein
MDDKDVTNDKPPSKNKHDVPPSPGPKEVRRVVGDGKRIQIYTESWKKRPASRRQNKGATRP